MADPISAPNAVSQAFPDITVIVAMIVLTATAIVIGIAELEHRPSATSSDLRRKYSLVPPQETLARLRSSGLSDREAEQAAAALSSNRLFGNYSDRIAVISTFAMVFNFTTPIGDYLTAYWWRGLAAVSILIVVALNFRYFERRSRRQALVTTIALAGHVIFLTVGRARPNTSSVEIDLKRQARRFRQHAENTHSICAAAVRIGREISFLTTGRRVDLPKNSFARTIYAAGVEPASTRRSTDAVESCVLLIRTLLYDRSERFSYAAFSSDAPALPVRSRPIQLAKTALSLPLVVAIAAATATALYGVWFSR